MADTSIRNKFIGIPDRAVEQGYVGGLQTAIEMLDSAIKNPATDTLPTKMVLQVLKAAMLQEIDDFEDLN